MKKGEIYESKVRMITEIKVAKILEVARPVGMWAKKMGIGLTVFSVGVFWWIYWPLLQAEINYKSKLQIPNSKSQEIPKSQIPEKQIIDEYKIQIPKMGADAKVVSNIDPFDKVAYTKALLQGVVEASGLAHPGEAGTTFLFAHSVGNRIDYARYNAVFYLLDRLEVKDKIYINYHGKAYQYEVAKKEILPASDLKYFAKQMEEEKLVLQTCYPPGTSWKRLIVVAKRV